MKFIAWLFLVGVLAGCSGFSRSLVLERATVANLKVSEETRNDKVYLVFSGLSGHSAYAVKDVDIAGIEGGKWVKVRVTSDTAGRRGDFTFVIEQTPGLSRVVFGERKEVIWRPFQGAFEGTLR